MVRTFALFHVDCWLEGLELLVKIVLSSLAMEMEAIRTHVIRSLSWILQEAPRVIVNVMNMMVCDDQGSLVELCVQLFNGCHFMEIKREV